MSLPPELQSALLGRRVVFLRGRLDDATANNVIAQLLLIGQIADGLTIELYVDSPGGSLSSALSVYDVLQTMGVPVSTVCIGTAGGASVLVLAGGANGLRFALPHARCFVAEEQVDVPAGRPTEVDEAARLHARWQAALTRHVAHSAAQLARDLASGRWLSAAEARDYGLVDGIMPSRPATPG